MNRTALLFLSAAALAVVAVVVGRPGPAPVVVGSPLPWVAPPIPPKLDPNASATTDGVLLSAQLSHPAVLTSGQDVYLEVTVKAPDRKPAARPPLGMVVVIDRSGSMAGEKIIQAKRAANLIVDRLKDNDTLAIVDYGSNVRSFPSRAIDDGSKVLFHSFIDSIEDEGGTNISGGLDEAARLVPPVSNRYTARRVVLLSDGQPTEGDTSVEGLGRRVTALRRQGVTVSAIGIGADFNDSLMMSLAERGGGTYAFVQNEAATTQALNYELEAASRSLLHSVRIELNPAPGITVREVVGHSFSTLGPRRVFVSVPDLSPNESHSMVIRATVAPGAASEHEVFAGVSATYDASTTEGDSGGRVSATVLMARTADANFVGAHQNRTIALTIARAESAELTKRAIDAYAAGDFAKADSARNEARAALQGAVRAVGAAAVAPEIRDMESTLESVRSADEGSRNIAAKAANVQTAKKKNMAAFAY